MAIPEDCPDPKKNIEDAINKVQDAYLSSQMDAMKNISDNLKNSVNNLPADKPVAEQLSVLCAAINGSADKFNDLRHSCNFDPTGCLREVLNSGVLDGNPALAGAALAGAVFIDAITGNFEPPLVGPIVPEAELGVTPPTPPANIDLPEIPAPPISDECPDPIDDLNTALKSAEDTYLNLHKSATEKLANEVDDVLGGIGGLPTEAKISALCVTAEAGFNVAGGLIASCSIDVGQCLKQVLQSGIFGSNPALGGASAAAAFFLDNVG